MTNEVRIEPYRATDTFGMEIRDLSPDMEAVVLSPEYLLFLEKAGPGYSLIIDDETVMCMIFCKLLYSGVAEVVVLASSLVEKHRRIVQRVCKKCADDVQEVHKLHRLEARIPETATRNRLWAESLGMVAEGPIRAFGPNGEDYIQYAKIRKDLICRHSWQQ